MQDTQMLRLEIDRNLNILPLESLRMAAKYIVTVQRRGCTLRRWFWWEQEFGEYRQTRTWHRELVR